MRKVALNAAMVVITGCIVLIVYVALSQVTNRASPTTGSAISTSVGIVPSLPPTVTLPVATPMPLEGWRDIVLEPAANTPTVSREEAIGIAKSKLGHVTIQSAPRASYWLATTINTETNSSYWMDEEPVWVVTYDLVIMPVSVPPPPDDVLYPKEVLARANVIIRANTGKFIVSSEDELEPGF